MKAQVLMEMQSGLVDILLHYHMQCFIGNRLTDIWNFICSSLEIDSGLVPDTGQELIKFAQWVSCLE